jgi:hypothetical protein
MKKFYMTIVAMLCGVAAMAQGLGTLSCEDVTATKGEETAYLEVMLTTENVDAITGIQFFFTLPEGVTIALDEDEELDVSFPIAKKAHNCGIKNADGGGYMVYLGGDNSLSYKAATNPVAKIGLNVDNAANGTYEILFNKAAMSDKSTPVQSFEVPDFTCNLTIKGGDAINGINAADSKAPIYNVAGQRVNKAQKGVYIQNGKKVAVK